MEFSDGDGIAYALDEFVTNIGQSLSDDLEIINCNPLDSVMRKPSSIFLAPVTERDFTEIVQNLEMSGQEREKLPVYLLIKFITYLLPISCENINNSSTYDKFPNPLKSTIYTVIPIFK